MIASAEPVRDLLAGARRIVVLTGAGVSAESGVPTFRGAGGMWRSHRPEELATPQAFRRDPCLVWGWYAWRRTVVAGCRPNEGHRALARWAAARSGSLTLVTQNVDDLHERAAAELAARDGQSPTVLPLHLHGSIFGDRCSGCGARFPATSPVDASCVETLPRCVRCRWLLRPDVVWFGESLDRDLLEAAFSAATEADVCVAVGTSGVVHPAAAIPLATVRAGGALVEVNPEETPLSGWADFTLRGPAAELLPALLPEIHAGPDRTHAGPGGNPANASGVPE